jgi:photosystem II stability/assembly factor-like uncharacterized protein
MKNKISRVLGIGLSAGLVFGLIGALFAAPVSADQMKWTIVNTPSWEDGVILPGNDIIDYDISGDDGSVIYVVAEVDRECSTWLDDSPTFGYGLFKSTDGGVTWTDITDNVKDATNLPTDFDLLQLVAVAPDDADWVAVLGYGSGPMVVASKDGGDNFAYAGDMVDNSAGVGTNFSIAYDLEVSPETNDIHVIAACGFNNKIEGSVYRLDAGTWLSGSWEDTSYYYGWDGDADGNTGGHSASSILSYAIIDGEFSPNYDVDSAFVCIGVAFNPGGPPPGLPCVQTGDMESKQWGAEGGLPDPVKVESDDEELWSDRGMWLMGVALPNSYDATDPGTRSLFLYVDAYDSVTDLIGGFVFRLDNTDLSPTCGPSGDPLLASIDVYGDADTGKMMVGKYADFEQFEPVDEEQMRILSPDPCAGVAVWHTEELDFCCPQWDAACKDPSGPFIARVMYTPDGLKEYATTTGSNFGEWGGIPLPPPYGGYAGDESAFSVSRDDAVSFNQIGLIDTDIDMLFDVAVCPDCGTIYLSSINDGATPCVDTWLWWEDGHCDSVWRSYDNGDTWERIFHGDWDGTPLLRLPCDAVEDCCDQDPVAPSGTIYLGIQGTKDIFYSRDCGQCWNKPPATKTYIEDFAVESENIVYVIDAESNFSKSTQYGRRWSDSVDMGLDSSWTITACCKEGFIVVGPITNDAVAWSDDGGESWNLTDKLPADVTALVQVACDPNCPNIVYAAGYVGGIYRTDLTDGSWTDMNAVASIYTGLAVARTGGALYASSEEIQVDTNEDNVCDRFDIGPLTEIDYYSGVARNLTPCETACCGTEDWDYLICGLDTEPSSPTEYFMAMPSALRICGCLSADTNTILWAIDWTDYDVTDGSDGSLWSYEDCAAKMGPTLTSPADGAVIACEPCAGCDAANFTLKWERPCIACSYDIEIMDEDGNVIVSWTDEEITGSPPSLFVDGTTDDTTYSLECSETYTWHVRMADTDCECVHSPWSDTWSFTIAAGALDAIQLLSPDKGSLDIPINNIGFSWTSVRNASSYSFVLSPNANLTGALASQSMSTTAFNCAGPLDYGKAYYWQVIAWEDGTRLNSSAIGVFNTMAEPVAPTPPVVVEEAPAPVINIPGAQQITPIWIYAVIGVGAALTVLVIVLIARSRRP